MAPAFPGEVKSTAAVRTPSESDRLGPTRRPPGLAIGHQEWRRLLFLHWSVPAEALRPLVPRCLSLDTYGGTAYVGLVPFFVQAASPLRAARAFGLEFLETNVRTYVHVGGRDPGVYFFSLDAASLLAVLGARVAFGLPYFHARMQERRAIGEVEYSMRRFSGTQPAMYVRYQTGVSIGSAQPGTLEHFLIERYLLHVQRGPTLWTVQVHHRPYPLQQARLVEARDQLVGAAGITVPNELPLVHYATGVDVEIIAPRILPNL
jgi:uncharacterized protein YqjF (DUF2071 family)